MHPPRVPACVSAIRECVRARYQSKLRIGTCPSPKWSRLARPRGCVLRPPRVPVCASDIFDELFGVYAISTNQNGQIPITRVRIQKIQVPLGCDNPVQKFGPSYFLTASIDLLHFPKLSDE